MVERTIHILAKSDISVVRDLNGKSADNTIGDALNGDAFAWENPSDLSLTFSGATTAISFDDADGLLKDDPFSGNRVIDQQLTEPVTINGTTYTPSTETIRWKDDPPPVNVEAEYKVTLYDDSGTAYQMVGVSITEGYSTSVVGVMFDGPAPPAGTTLHYIQGVSSYTGTGQSIVIPDDVPCFLAGTLIETPSGPRPIETLHVGAQVLTLDRGVQTIRWIGCSSVCGLGELAPVRIKAGALGNHRDLYLSPQHRVLLRSTLAELYFGQCDVLVPAISLVDGDRVRQSPMRRATYVHLALDTHSMIYSEGIATETLFPGAMALNALSPAARRELCAVFPDFEASSHQLCRLGLSMKEARYLTRRSAHERGKQSVCLA